jgi:putative transposase
LKLSQLAFCDTPVPVSDTDKAAMDKIDGVCAAHPYFGARRMSLKLKDRRIPISRKHTATLMRMGATFSKKNLSKRHPDHPVCPYLFRDVEITHSNQVWSMDIKLGRGFVYLTAVIDWKCRYVLS